MRAMSSLAPSTTSLAASQRQQLTGIACGMGAGAVWGLVFLAPELLRGFGPLLQSVARYLCYGLFAVAMITPRWHLVRKLSAQQWLILFWLAFTGNTFYYVLLTAAVHNGGIAMTSLILGFVPVVVTVVGSRERHAVPLARLVPSLLLCIVGALFISWQALSEEQKAPVMQQFFGLLCALGSLACWTVYTVANSRCLRRWRHMSSHDWNLMVGIATGAQSLLLLPLALFLEDSHSGGEWANLAAVSVGVAILASMIGNSLWNRMSRLLPLTLVGQMILFETLFALLYCFLWEQRLPTLLELGALVAVILGVLTCFAAHRPPANDQSTKDTVVA
jgi:Permeases of the drug/metabolite transporter (DMT) superfamily